MISIIVAMARNQVIGDKGSLPWHLKTDLQRFKRLTVGHMVIVGRKTHESIISRLGHPLPDRRTIVVTRQRNYAAENVEVVNSWEGAAALAIRHEVFVIGGAQVYSAALPLAARLYLTTVEAEIEGDAYFPYFNLNEWQVVHEEYNPADENNDYPHHFRLYERSHS